ncbi:hypothetical protein V1V65_22670 (plasmid) [Enterobacter hormaechei]
MIRKGDKVLMGDSVHHAVCDGFACRQNA